MAHRESTGSRWWYLLLLIPIAALLAVPVYARETPELAGFPFFYWYQFVWVPISALITYFVYKRTRTVGRPPDERGYDEGVPFEPAPTGTARRVPREVER